MKLGKYVAKHWKSYTLASIFLLVSMGLELAFPQVTKVIINEVLLGDQYQNLVWYLLAILGIGVGRSIFSYYKEFTFDKNCITIGTEIRKDVFSHIQGLSLDYFDDTNTGELMARVRDDVEKVKNLLGMTSMVGIEAIIHTVAFVILMFCENWIMAFLPLVCIAVCGVIAVWMEKKLDKVYDDISEENAELTTVAEENISGVRTVKAFAREKYEIEKFRKHNRKYCDLNMEEIKVLLRYYPIFPLMGMLLPVACTVLGGYFVIKGQMSLGALAAFVVYARNCTSPIEQIGWVTNEFSSAIASKKKIDKIFKQESNLAEVENPIRLDHVEGEVSFSHVSLELGGKQVLEDISFTLEKGKTLGIMGETGSGKSTIVNLLQRFFDPNQGEICIDHTPIASMDLQQVRSASAVVMQDVMLFSDTIEENIRMGRRDEMTMEEVKEAAKMAQASDFIEKLEEGYQTVIGERGVGLSGGQKQRISIARAFSKKAPILILDDATSALDTETEQAIQKTLDAVENVTRIIIAHRISAVRKADEILYLKNGRIVERGSHEELMAQKGLYYDTYCVQYGQADGKEVR